MFFTMTNGDTPNFKIIPYATEAELLAAVPVENTIGVVTSQKITEWIFSPAEPEKASEGLLWISTGTTSRGAFNALKKNGIMVYPIKGKQYVSGNLVDVTCKSYQNGAWVDWWNGELYDSGDMYESVTGGWAAGEAMTGSTVSFEKEYIELSTGSGFRVHVETAKTVNVSQYHTLVAKVSVMKHEAGRIRLGYATVAGASLAVETAHKTELTPSGIGEYELRLDISAAPDNVYIIVGLGYGGDIVRIEKVWME